MDNRLKLPVGIEDFEEIRKEGFYYIDKTKLIEQLLMNWGKVNLFTRPRRFGKTLNMSMFKSFFEIGTDKSVFDELYISRNKKLCNEHMGKYPVIFLTFKDIKFASWELTFAKIAELVQEEFGRHKELGMSEKLEPYEKEYFRKILAGQANEVELSSSLQKLSKMLHEHYGKAPIIMIDEYDAGRLFEKVL